MRAIIPGYDESSFPNTIIYPLAGSDLSWWLSGGNYNSSPTPIEVAAHCSDMCSAGSEDIQWAPSCGQIGKLPTQWLCLLMTWPTHRGFLAQSGYILWFGSREIK